MSILSRNPSEDGRPLRWAGLALLALVLAVVGWMGISLVGVKSDLDQARQSAQQVKDALLEGKAEDATRSAQNAASHAQSARDTTHSVPWSFFAGVPFLGAPVKAGQQISDVVAGLASDILQPAAEAGIGLSPAKLYRDGQVDLQLLGQQEPELVELASTAGKLAEQAAAIPPAGFLTPVDNARTQLQGQTSQIAAMLHNTALAAQVGPAMMGADGPRAYLLAFQTNAEARGTGGLLGGTGILRFDNGKATVDTLASNRELYGAKADVDLGPEFTDLYGGSSPFSDVRNSNQSSHFPYAAQIWKSMWERETGDKLDGVIALDPVTLSYILGAVGDVTIPDGEVVTADNVVELTESTAYFKFPNDQTARKAYLQDIANAVVKKMTGKVKSPGKLLDALGRAVNERRIMVWSQVPGEQEVLAQTPLAHVIPDDSAPYAEVIVNNYGGNKMDYYLKREIEYVADGCAGDMRNSTITVRLTNTATGIKPSDWVEDSQGLPADFPFKPPPGTMISSIRVIATKGAKLIGLTSNGERAAAVTELERGHPAFEIQVVIPPGKSGELSFVLSEPTSPGAPQVPVQPLVDSVAPVVKVPECE